MIALHGHSPLSPQSEIAATIFYDSQREPKGCLNQGGPESAHLRNPCLRKRWLSETLSSESLAFGIPVFGIPDFGIPGFRNHWLRESPSLGFPYQRESQFVEFLFSESLTFGIPVFGIPDFGIPAFGIPTFGISVEFRHPLIRHPFDTPQDSGRSLGEELGEILDEIFWAFSCFICCAEGSTKISPQTPPDLSSLHVLSRLLWLKSRIFISVSFWGMGRPKNYMEKSTWNYFARR